MKKNILLIVPFFCLIFTLGCKKQLESTENTDLSIFERRSSKFPSIENANQAQSSMINSLLLKGDDNFFSVTRYIDSLLAVKAINKPNLSSLRNVQSSVQETNALPGDFSEINTGFSRSFYGETYNATFISNIDDFGQYYNGYLSVPKFRATHEYGGNLPVRGLYVSVQIPYEYYLKFNPQYSNKTYYKFTSGSGLQVRMDISGSVGTITDSYAYLNIDDIFIYGTDGVQSATAAIQKQEVRSRTIDVHGNQEVSLTAKLVGRKTSTGQTITSVQNLQAFFRYNCSFVFWGNNTGCTVGYNQYLTSQLNGGTFNVYSLNKPVVQTTGEVITYQGPVN